jgi:hypothetical protein
MPYVVTTTIERAVEALEVNPLLDALRPVLPIKTLQTWIDTLHALIELPETGGTIELPDGTMIDVRRVPVDDFDVDAFNARHS